MAAAMASAQAIRDRIAQSLGANLVSEIVEMTRPDHCPGNMG